MIIENRNVYKFEFAWFPIFTDLMKIHAYANKLLYIYKTKLKGNCIYKTKLKGNVLAFIWY